MQYRENIMSENCHRWTEGRKKNNNKVFRQKLDRIPFRINVNHQKSRTHRRDLFKTVKEYTFCRCFGILTLMWGDNTLNPE